MDVFWTKFALADLDQIQDFIAQDSPISAYRLAVDIVERTDRLLAENPFAGRQGRVPETRELVLSRSSYIMVYRVSHRVEILAVVHGARTWPDEFKT